MRTKIVVAMLCAALAGCAGMGDKAPVDPMESAGVLLFFSVKEPDKEMRRIRMFVHRDFMRIEPAEYAPTSFTLFDRRKQLVYEVSDEARTIKTIKTIKAAPAAAAQQPLAITEEGEPSRLLGQRPTMHYRYSANGALCYNVVIVEDMLDEVVAALREYRQVMAGREAWGQRDGDCALAFEMQEPARLLEHGFPVRIWDPAGNQRFLLEYQENAVPPQPLNQLPKGYQRID